MNPRKHWPSLFLKSNSSTPSYNQLPETYSSAMRAPYSGIGELPQNYVLERESSPPKAKTRWNPKPEQIQILESIFSSGMINPPREEIKRIRAQLEVYGQVGDVNVFYWFQNRKSRSKRKPRLPAAQRSKSRTVSGTQSSTSSTSTSRSTSVQSRTIPDISHSPGSSMHSNINGDQYRSSAVPVSQFAGHHYDMQAMCQEMNRTSSVPSQTFTALLNSPPSPMHSNIGDQYSSYSTVPVSSFAGHHYNPQAVYEEMCKTSTSVPSQTFNALPNHPPNSMHSHNRDQYCSSSAVPVASSADDLYDMERLYEEMTKTSAFDQSKTITDVPKNPLNPMHCDIRDQYISSTAPVSSSAGQVYDLDSLLEEMSKTSASVWPQTVIDIPNSLPDSMHSNIQDQYYSSSAVPVPSPTEHLNNLDSLLEEMINYDELNNMQAVGTAAAGGGQNMLNEGTGAVQDGSTINTNPQISVFINDAQVTVPSGPINFRHFFGDNALLFHSSGEPVLLNEFGFIILEHGAMYFLM